MSSPSLRSITSHGGAHSVGALTAVPSIDSIIPSPSPVVEGNTVTWTVTTSNVPDGTSLTWVSGSNPDSTPDTGSVTINSNTGTFTLTAVDDGTAEGNELFYVSVTGTVNGVPLSTQSSPLTIQDPAVGVVNSVTGPASVNEGSSATFTVSTSNIPDGSTLGWSVVFGGNSNPAAVNADFTSASGSFTVTGNSGTFSVPISADATTEGAEDFRALANYSTSGSSATSGYVQINDTSTSPAASIVSVTGPSSVNEGSSATINVTTANIPDSSTLSWAINYRSSSGSGDFSANSGTFTVTSNAGSFTIPVVADTTTEGPEIFRAVVTWTVPNGGGGETGSSADITINDTSTTPAATAITAVSPSASNIDEGSTLSVLVATENYPDGNKVFNYTINPGSGLTAGDFTSNSLSGIVIVNSSLSLGSGSFNLTPTSDSTTEGPETFTITVTDPLDGTRTYTSTTVTINDTSTSPPTYAVSPASSSYDEGTTATMNVTTTNVPDGTTLYWTASTPSGGDLGTSSGSFTINSNAANVNRPALIADNTTEGPETVTFNVRTGSTSGTIVATTTFTINDTSQAPATYSLSAPATVDEGVAGTMTVTTTSVADGTTLYWTATPTSDLDASSGSFTINSNSGTFTITPTLDGITPESNETITVNVRRFSTSGTIVATDTFDIVDKTETASLAGTSAFPTVVFGLSNEGSGPYYPGWYFYSNGEVWEIENGPASYQYDWCTNTPPTQYNWAIRFTAHSGDAVDSGFSDSLGVWLPLTSNRKVRWRVNEETFASGSVKVELSRTTDGSEIIATGYYGIEYESGE